MTKYREIIRLTGMGFSQRDIMASCGVAQKTVVKIQKRARELNLSSGSNRPLTGAPNSYYKTGNGEHIFVYDGDGKLIYDISSSRVKGFKINVAPNGVEHYQAYKLEGAVPDAIKKLFGW